MRNEFHGGGPWFKQRFWKDEGADAVGKGGGEEGCAVGGPVRRKSELGATGKLGCNLPLNALEERIADMNVVLRRYRPVGVGGRCHEVG